MLTAARKRKAEDDLILPLCFHWVGNYANKITLNNGTLVFSQAVKKFQTCELDYHHLIYREGNNTWCSFCSFNAFTSDGKISNMITHIKRVHPEHLPYSDMLESYKNQKEREWDY